MQKMDKRKRDVLLAGTGELSARRCRALARVVEQDESLRQFQQFAANIQRQTCTSEQESEMDEFTRTQILAAARRSQRPQMRPWSVTAAPDWRPARVYAMLSLLALTLGLALWWTVTPDAEPPVASVADAVAPPVDDWQEWDMLAEVEWDLLELAARLGELRIAIEMESAWVDDELVEEWARDLLLWEDS